MIVTYERNVQFYHYGVEGMKWGIRRYQNPDGTLTPLGRTRLGRKAVNYNTKSTKAKIEGNSAKAEKYGKKFKKVDKKLKNPDADIAAEEAEKQSFFKQASSKDAKTLSSEELEHRIKRLTSEKDYKRLMKERENPDVERGKEAAKSVAEKIGKTTATAVGTSLAVYFATRAISNAMGVKTPEETKFEEMWKFAKPPK